MNIRKEQASACSCFCACIKLESELNNIGSLRSAVTLCDIECDCLSFVQSLESFSLDCGIMYEYIFSFISCDESITFLCIKPFNFACSHRLFESPILCTQDMQCIFIYISILLLQFFKNKKKSMIQRL